jgi:hypothetical protein
VPQRFFPWRTLSGPNRTATSRAAIGLWGTEVEFRLPGLGVALGHLHEVVEARIAGEYAERSPWSAHCEDWYYA